MWRLLFIVLTTIVLYFAYGIAMHGGVLPFFAGVVSGAIITYLFMRYRKEAAASVMVASQHVNVNVNQGLQLSTDERIDELSRRMECLIENMSPRSALPSAYPQGLTESQINAILERKLRELIDGT